jgi:hypothetical protein
MQSSKMNLSNLYLTTASGLICMILFFTLNLKVQGQTFASLEDGSSDYATSFVKPANTSKKTENSILIENKTRPGLNIGFASAGSSFENHLGFIQKENSDSQFLIEKGIDGIVKIKNIKTGEYLEVTDDMAINGGTISLGEKRDDPAQEFQLIPLGDGYYALVSQLNFNLAVEVSQHGIGSPFKLNNRKRTDGQAFKLVKN